MGTTVLDAGPSSAPGVHLYAHCLAGQPGGVVVLAVNTERGAARELTIPMRGERYTLTSAPGLLSRSLELNGNPLALGKDGAMPALEGVPTQAGPVIASGGEHHVPGVRERGERQLPVTARSPMRRSRPRRRGSGLDTRGQTREDSLSCRGGQACPRPYRIR